MSDHTCTASAWLLNNGNGAVGLTTPILTGAISDSATSLSATVAWWMSAENTLLHLSTASELKQIQYKIMLICELWMIDWLMQLNDTSTAWSCSAREVNWKRNNLRCIKRETRKLKSLVVPMHNTFWRNERKTFVGKTRWPIICGSDAVFYIYWDYKTLTLNNIGRVGRTRVMFWTFLMERYIWSPILA